MIDGLRGRLGAWADLAGPAGARQPYSGRTDRPPSKRTVRDAVLLERIPAVHQANDQAFGVRRVCKQLGRNGVRVARCTVARLMRADGLHGMRRGRKRRTTIPEPGAGNPGARGDCLRLPHASGGGERRARALSEVRDEAACGRVCLEAGGGR
jgi:transposase InsO family protein